MYTFLILAKSFDNRTPGRNGGTIELETFNESEAITLVQAIRDRGNTAAWIESYQNDIRHHWMVRCDTNTGGSIVPQDTPSEGIKHFMHMARYFGESVREHGSPQGTCVLTRVEHRPEGMRQVRIAKVFVANCHCR